MTTDADTEVDLRDLAVEFEGVSDETPQTAEATPGSIDQAGAQKGGASTQAAQPTPHVDLTALPEFREVQSKYDRRYADLQRQHDDLMRRYQEIANQGQIQLENQLMTGMDEADSIEARQKIIDQIANSRADREIWQRTEQARTWRTYVTEQASKEGLDPNVFLDKPYKSTEEFVIDLRDAVLEDLRKKVKQLESGAAPEVVNKKVEQLAHEAGYNAIDAGTPKAVAEPDSWERDLLALQKGRMDPKKFADKWRRG